VAEKHFCLQSNLRRRKIFIAKKFLPCKQQTHAITKDIVDQPPSMRDKADLCRALQQQNSKQEFQKRQKTPLRAESGDRLHQ